MAPFDHSPEDGTPVTAGLQVELLALKCLLIMAFKYGIWPGSQLQKYSFAEEK